MAVWLLRSHLLGLLESSAIHFARDAGVPTDPLAALRSIAAGDTRQVDVGEVNGHFFLNNSSIELYVDLVRDRERQQTRLGLGKWPAFAWALVGALRRYPFLTVVLTVDGQTFSHRTPFVFVGNNAYLTEGLQIGQRDGLRGGELSLYVARCRTRRTMAPAGSRPARARRSSSTGPGLPGAFRDAASNRHRASPFARCHRRRTASTRGTVAIPNPSGRGTPHRAFLTSRGGEMRTVVHLSDLHFGKVDQDLLAPLVKTVNALAPEVVVVSGDLTQRARTAQFAQVGKR